MHSAKRQTNETLLLRNPTNTSKLHQLMLNGMPKKKTQEEYNENSQGVLRKAISPGQK